MYQPAFPVLSPRMHLTEGTVPTASWYHFELGGSLWCHLMHLLANTGCNAAPQEHGWVGRAPVDIFCHSPLPIVTQMVLHVLSFLGLTAISP